LALLLAFRIFNRAPPATLPRPRVLVVRTEARRQLQHAIAPRQQVVGARAIDVELCVLVAAIVQAAVADDAQLLPEPLAMVVVVTAYAPAPVLGDVTRIARQVGEAFADLPMRVVGIVAREVSGVVDFQFVAKMHHDPLLSPAMIHLHIRPQRRPGITRLLPGVVDVALHEAGADIPAWRR